MNAYSLYSKSLNYHNLPFFADNNTSAVYQLRNAIRSGSVPAFDLGDLELHLCGFFNPETGKFEIPFSDGNCTVCDDLTQFVKKEGE